MSNDDSKDQVEESYQIPAEIAARRTKIKYVEIEKDDRVEASGICLPTSQ